MFSEGLANVRIGDKRGYIDASGEVVIPLEFDGAKPFRCGHGCVTIKRGQKYITRAGKVAFSEMREPREGFAAVRRSGLWGFVDEAGELRIEPRFKDVQDFSGGLAGVTDGEGKSGFIDETGRLVVAPRYDSVDPFRSGFATVTYRRDGDFAVGLIDTFGVEIFPPKLEVWIHGVSNGLVRRQTRAKKDGDWKRTGFGLVDLRGREIAPATYTFIDDFTEELARFKVNRDSDARYGFIGPDGSIVQPVDYFTNTGCFAIRFAKTPDKAAQARIKRVIRQALHLLEPKWEWKKDVAILWLGEDLGQPDTFEDVAKALLELHDRSPILEVVNHYAREPGLDPWDKWTHAQQEMPSRGLDDPNGLSVWSR